MLHIPKIGDYLKILSDNEVKNFVVINFGKYLINILNLQEKNFILN